MERPTGKLIMIEEERLLELMSGESYHMGEVDRLSDELAAYELTGKTPEQVAEWAKAEQEGRLGVLPCKVGDTVYYLQQQYSGQWVTKPCTVSEIQIDRWARVYGIEERQNRQMWYFDDFGKTVFLTREAAEQALKERGKNG